MEVIKTGLAAFGMSGQVFHAPFISPNPQFELSKIVERSKNLSKEKYPKAEIVRSFDELIADAQLELIIINTPDSTHYEYAKAALLAGKHVVIEKPITSNADQAKELVDIAKSKNLMISAYQNRRWDADFLAVKEILAKNLLGRVVEFGECGVSVGLFAAADYGWCDRFFLIILVVKGIKNICLDIIFITHSTI